MDTHDQGIDRRSLLVGGVTVFGGMYLLGRSARAEDRRTDKKSKAVPRTLLLLELNGGNDGLSCVVPYGDDAYHRARPRTGIKPDEVLKIDEYRGFHPNLKKLRGVFGEGKLAIIEGAGYPSPNHSHFTSQDIWHTARATGRASGDGWIGRTLAAMYGDEDQIPHGVHVGQTLPFALKSSTHPVVCFDEPPAYRWVSNGDSIVDASTRSAGMNGDSPLSRIRSIARNAKQSSEDVRRAAGAYKPRVEYKNETLSQDLRTVAALLQGDIGCRVLSVTQKGYDTHENQRYQHDVLMAELDNGLSTFLEDVRGTEAGDNLVVLVFSEFGRRVQDNASMGTDHGTAGPMFVVGTPVTGGLYGKHPSLENLVEGDLVHTTDFRTVYSTVLQRWFALDSTPILGAKYDIIKGCLA